MFFSYSCTSCSHRAPQDPKSSRTHEAVHNVRVQNHIHVSHLNFKWCCMTSFTWIFYFRYSCSEGLSLHPDNAANDPDHTVTYECQFDKTWMRDGTTTDLKFRFSSKVWIQHFSFSETVHTFWVYTKCDVVGFRRSLWPGRKTHTTKGGIAESIDIYLGVCYYAHNRMSYIALALS